MLDFYFITSILVFYCLTLQAPGVIADPVLTALNGTQLRVDWAPPKVSSCDTTQLSIIYSRLTV